MKFSEQKGQVIILLTDQLWVPLKKTALNIESIKNKTAGRIIFLWHSSIVNLVSWTIHSVFSERHLMIFCVVYQDQPSHWYFAGETIFEWCFHYKFVKFNFEKKKQLNICCIWRYSLPVIHCPYILEISVVLQWFSEIGGHINV